MHTIAKHLVGATWAATSLRTSPSYRTCVRVASTSKWNLPTSHLTNDRAGGLRPLHCVSLGVEVVVKVVRTPDNFPLTGGGPVEGKIEGRGGGTWAYETDGSAYTCGALHPRADDRFCFYRRELVLVMHNKCVLAAVPPLNRHTLVQGALPNIGLHTGEACDS